MRKKALRAQLERTARLADDWERVARDEIQRTREYARRLGEVMQRNKKRDWDLRQACYQLDPHPYPDVPKRVHAGWLHLDIEGVGMCYCIPEALLSHSIRKLRKWVS